MRRILFTIALAAATEPVRAQAGTAPHAGLVISRSVVIRPGTYRLLAKPTLDSALLVIRGNDLTVDLSGVRLIGGAEPEDPDRAAGVAIFVDGGANVTIKNGQIRGYKVAILARGTRNLRLIDNDLSFNWKPRLHSIVEHESLADWLSYHHNEKDEWLRYGAAIYLNGVRGGELRGNTVHQGMNGLLMTQTDSLLVWNNDFSFNSGLGIGMYRSSHNRVMHNRVDFNVRGYSEGFYRRGQDSAGILIYEQSDSNTVAFNSVTHGGDGLFVWAGQHTMDTGQGGVNDNLFFGNDFSWAPTNGMEATFSRNQFIGNRIVGSDYGLWGGYSYKSLIADNTFERNRVGIAIEHGQDNLILQNRFKRDSTDIQVWANKIEPSDWGYPKHRDTRSRDYWIHYNIMTGARVALRIGDTQNIVFVSNEIDADTLLTATGDTSGIKLRSNVVADFAALPSVRPLDGGRKVLPSEYAEWPRSTIIVDEWGPFDWKSPKLWPADSSLATPLKLRVVGPPGAGGWRLLRTRGASISPHHGRIGDTIVVKPDAGAVEDWLVSLEYRGQPTRSPTGATRPANAPYVFSYSRFDAKPRWNVNVYAWTDSTHPLKTAPQFDALLRGERGAPVLSLATSRLDYVWYRPRVAGWPPERVGVVATASVTLPRGSYALRTISDDGIRVFVDDTLVIDDWTVHESQVREVPIQPGSHRIRVEYFQLDGWTELRVELVKQN